MPQEGNLFRQGANLDSTGLKPVKADSYEVGMRGNPTDTLTWELSAYWMEKRDDILSFNDGSGPTQTKNGETRHEGIEAESVYLVSYWMDDVNMTKYEGHNLINLRLNYEAGEAWEIFVRATNVFDRRWATSAQVSSGQPQYAPGLPFSLYGGVSRLTWGEVLRRRPRSPAVRPGWTMRPTHARKS